MNLILINLADISKRLFKRMGDKLIKNSLPKSYNSNNYVI